MKILINARVSPSEAAVLAATAKAAGRTKTDILRECIRALASPVPGLDPGIIAATTAMEQRK